MEKIDKAIEILQALKDGENIEYYFSGKWFNTSNLDVILDFMFRDINDVRIAKEPTYRPYANAEEFLKASKEHGPYIKCPDDEYIIANRINVGQIEWARRFYIPENLCESNQSLINKSFEDLLEENYTWQDGTPCGILEE